MRGRESNRALPQLSPPPKRMKQEISKDDKPVSHVDHRQQVLEPEIELLLSSVPPHGELAIIAQIAEKRTLRH
jgi:hypothetical protein